VVQVSARRQLKVTPTHTNFRKQRWPGTYDFSFSGLKTAVLRTAQAAVGKENITLPSKDLPALLSEAQKADITASFQRIAVETMVNKAILAFEKLQPKSVIIAGGVVANHESRRRLREHLPVSIDYTDITLCTNNGAMIATLGCFTALHHLPEADPYTLDVAPNLSM
jgi:N6-L-threonylcarbamoyladenine synthase